MEKIQLYQKTYYDLMLITCPFRLAPCPTLPPPLPLPFLPPFPPLPRPLPRPLPPLSISLKKNYPYNPPPLTPISLEQQGCFCSSPRDRPGSRRRAFLKNINSVIMIINFVLESNIYNLKWLT